eukprot:UN13548
MGSLENIPSVPGAGNCVRFDLSAPKRGSEGKLKTPTANSAEFQKRLSDLTQRLEASDSGQKYIRIAEIGVGGFGKVYRAIEKTDHNRTVAIKVIDLEGKNVWRDGSAVEQVEKEIRQP